MLSSCGVRFKRHGDMRGRVWRMLVKRKKHEKREEGTEDSSILQYSVVNTSKTKLDVEERQKAVLKRPLYSLIILSLI